MMNRLIVLVTCLLFLMSCNQNKSGTEDIKNVIPVKVITAKTAQYQNTVIASGIVESKSQMKLSFKTGGIVEKIFVNEGDEVSKGQILANLKYTEIRSKADQANLAYEKAKRDYKRAENLYKDSVITLELFENAKTQLDITQENVNIAQFNLDHATIYAPAKGRILKKIASENEVMGAGYPVLVLGTVEDTWNVKTNCSDKQIVNIQLGDSAEISLDPYPNHKFFGVVSEIASAADPYTGTYQVEIEFKNENFLMKNGFIAKVKIISHNSAEKIKIPVGALLDIQNNEASVFKVCNGKPVRKKVEFIKIVNEFAFIDKGIESNDSIITDGATYLEDESVIKINN